jgi:hypothetical protein
LSALVETTDPAHATVRDRKRSNTPDNFQTPPHALYPLLRHLKAEWLIWEPACGKGNLTREMWERGYRCFGTDITHGRDFFSDTDLPAFDAIVTNPPFSVKDKFLERCYGFGKPFALLLPLTALGGKKRQSLFRRYGIEIILLPYRVDFETPLGRGGVGGAWFDVAWFTWKMNLPSALHFWQSPLVAEQHLEQFAMFGPSTLLMPDDEGPLALPLLEAATEDTPQEGD